MKCYNTIFKKTIIVKGIQIKILSILLITISLFGTSTYVEYPTLTKGMFKDENFLNYLVTILNKTIKKEKNLNLVLTTKTDEKKFRQDFSNAVYKLVALTPIEYVKHQKFYDKYTKKIILPKINDSFFNQYVLIANKDDTDIIKNIEDYTIYISDANVSADVWFNSLLKNKKNSSLNIIYTRKQNTMVNNVFLKRKILTVIDKFSYDIVIELNPQLQKKVKVLTQSDKIYFNFITLIHNKMTEAEISTYKKAEKKIKVFMNKSKMSIGGTVEGTKFLTEDKFIQFKKEIQRYIKINK